MEMERKKIASMEYGKIVFHSIPYHALPFSGRAAVQLEEKSLSPLPYSRLRKFKSEIEAYKRVSDLTW